MKYLFSSIVVVSLLLIKNGVTARWMPPQGATWNYVLEGKLNIANEPAEIVDIDYKTDSSVVNNIHNAGKKVICYFSGGTLEDFRKDKNKFYEVSNLVRNAYEEWAGENWLDIRKEGLKPLIKSRMQEAVNKKCDALEVDNLDGWQQDEVQSWSNPLTKEDTIKYAKWLGQTAHDMGISIGLKNALFMIDDVADYFDFAINESCATLKNPECNLYKNFLNKGKAVFAISYQNYLQYDYEKLCKNLNGLGISMIIKETQNLTQDSEIFDGKKQCGSSFSQSFISTTSNASVPQQNAVKVTTTTTVVKTTVKAKTMQQVDEAPSVVIKPTTTVKPTTTTTTIKPTTTTTTVKPTTTTTTVKPTTTTTTVKPTTTTTTVKPTTTTTTVKPTTTTTTVKSITTTTTIKHTTTTTIDKQSIIDIVASTKIETKVTKTEEPVVVTKSSEIVKSTTEPETYVESKYESNVHSNESDESLKETKLKVTSTITKTIKTKPTTTAKKEQYTKIEKEETKAEKEEEIKDEVENDVKIEKEETKVEKEETKAENEEIKDEVENDIKIEKEETKVEKEKEIEKEETKVEKEKETKDEVENEVIVEKEDDKIIDTNNQSVVKDNTKKENKNTKVNEQKTKEVEGLEDSSSGSSSVVTGVAVTGSVIGAAGVFILIKKNPKKYESIKRGLSRRATTVKRGASTVTRRLTSKKPKDSNESLNENDNVNVNISSDYTYNFSQNI